MKYTIIALILVLTACSAKVMKNSKPISIEESLKRGIDVHLKDQIVDVPIDLTLFIEAIPINGGTSQVLVESNIFFEGCTFTKPFITYRRNKDFGEISTQFFKNVSFVNCKFEDEANFKYSSFHGQVDFANTTFKENSNFQDAIMMQRCNFRGAFWQKEAHFQNSRYFHKSNFMETKANGHVLFQSANFRDEVNFSVSEFAKYVDFSLVKFDGQASFNYVDWKDRGVFNNSLWITDVNFIKPKFGDISFKGAEARSKFNIMHEEIRGTLVPMD